MPTVNDPDGTPQSVGTGEGGEGRGDVSARSNPRAYYASRDAALSYSWSAVNYNYDAGDTIIALKNTSDKQFVLEHVSVSAGTLTEFVFHFPADVTLAGTAITGVRLNRAGAGVALATAVSDETNNSQANVFWRETHAANEDIEPPFDETIRLGKNDIFAVDVVTVGTRCQANIEGYFE